MRSQKIRRIGLSFLTLLILLILLAAWNLNSGSLSLSWREVGWILLNPEGENGAIIWEIRLPRLLAAALLGGALSVISKPFPPKLNRIISQFSRYR